MVKQWQDFFWKGRYSSTVFDFNPSFDKVAASYDIPAEVVSKVSQIEPAVKRALSCNGPYLIEFKIDPNAHVYPMIPANGTIKDIILKPS